MLKFADRLLSVFLPKRCKYCGELIVPEKTSVKAAKAPFRVFCLRVAVFAVTAKRTAHVSRQKTNIPPSPLRFIMRVPSKPQYTA